MLLLHFRETLIPLLTKSDFFVPNADTLKLLELDITKLKCNFPLTTNLLYTSICMMGLCKKSPFYNLICQLSATLEQFVLPTELIHIWEPMLVELQANFPKFLPNLISDIFSQLHQGLYIIPSCVYETTECEVNNLAFINGLFYFSKRRRKLSKILVYNRLDTLCILSSFSRLNIFYITLIWIKNLLKI